VNALEYAAGTTCVPTSTSVVPRELRDPIPGERAPQLLLHSSTESGIMTRPLALGLLVAGILLIIFGVSATDSISSDVSRFFTGAPTEKAVWLLIAGMIAGIAGLFGLGRRVA